MKPGQTDPTQNYNPEQRTVAPTDLLVASTQEHLKGIPGLESKDREVFQWEAHDFLHAQKELFEQAIQKGHPQPAVAARVELMRRFVNDAEYRELGELCNLLALFPIFAAQQQRLELSPSQARRCCDSFY